MILFRLYSIHLFGIMSFPEISLVKLKSWWPSTPISSCWHYWSCLTLLMNLDTAWSLNLSPSYSMNLHPTFCFKTFWTLWISSTKNKHHTFKWWKYFLVLLLEYHIISRSLSMTLSRVSCSSNIHIIKKLGWLKIGFNDSHSISLLMASGRNSPPFNL